MYPSKTFSLILLALDR